MKDKIINKLLLNGSDYTEYTWVPLSTGNYILYNDTEYYTYNHVIERIDNPYVDQHLHMGYDLNNQDLLLLKELNHLMPSIGAVVLNYSNISDVSILSELNFGESLTHIYLNNNKIEDIIPLKGVRVCNPLHLLLNGNPIRNGNSVLEFPFQVLTLTLDTNIDIDQGAIKEKHSECNIFTFEI